MKQGNKRMTLMLLCARYVRCWGGACEKTRVFGVWSKGARQRGRELPNITVGFVFLDVLKRPLCLCCTLCQVLGCMREKA
ncbi:hypothetical protein [Bartonella sp. ML71XJBT]|uniref:hypothetical protein n=1 Tax=Bartonella sp. ML71XJBT TaxID=3019094 RepID=UPI0023620107|nr:hypothetical protein [Bartonella sp. ML71XJBT]